MVYIARGLEFQCENTLRVYFTVSVKLSQGEIVQIAHADGTPAGHIIGHISSCRRREVRSAIWFKLRACGCLVQDMDMSEHVCKPYLKA